MTTRQKREALRRVERGQRERIDRFADAFRAASKALVPLDSFEDRRRVIRYVCDEFGIDPTKLTS